MLYNLCRVFTPLNYLCKKVQIIDLQMFGLVFTGGKTEVPQVLYAPAEEAGNSEEEAEDTVQADQLIQQIQAGSR
jgi:hypothetical protein